MKIVILMMAVSGALCYLPTGEDSYMFSMFLRNLANRINGKEISEGDGVSYLDFTDGFPLDPRSSLGSMQEEEQQMFPLDYDGDGGVLNIHPSIRDQELLQHSNLWGKQFVSGGAGEGNQLLRPEGVKNKQEVKTDSSLPAYCNPPNPCPLGYTEDQGCIADFENSASYSRRYQAAQDCMCDSEHMFQCPNPNNMAMGIEDLNFNNFLEHSLKRIHTNPFLVGEKLPIAAKKGNNVFY